MRVFHLLFCCLLVGLAVFAPAAAVRVSGSTLHLNEVQIFTLRTTLGKQSAGERAQRIAATLRTVSEGDDVRVERQGANAVVFAGEKVIVRVSVAEARAHGSSPSILAEQWARRMREALALPPIQVASANAQLPPGRSKEIRLLGSRVASAVVQVSDPEVVRATRAGNVLRVVGLAAGEALVTLSAGDASEAVAVRIVPWAAPLPQRLSASVVGAVARLDDVRAAVKSSVLHGLRTEPGAVVRVLSITADPAPARSTKTAFATVSVTAPGAFPTEGRVQVDVRNEGALVGRELELWYCNHPESIKAPGQLFAAALQAGKSARMLYHHTNASAAGLFVSVVARNLSDKPARIAIVPGDGAPNKDPVRVGVEAGDIYLSRWLSGSGQVVLLPPWSATPIALRRIAPGETMSGLVALRLLDGGPNTILVKAEAHASEGLEPVWRAAASGYPWVLAGTRLLRPDEQNPGALSGHVYPQPFKEIETEYEVGGRFGFVRVGQKPIASWDDMRQLDGNFGVLYEIVARLRNPVAMVANVELVFEASAGYSAALFVLDGRVIRSPLLMSKAEFPISRVRLGPGESRTVRFMTVPLSGSSYPATIAIRPDQATLAQIAAMRASGENASGAPKLR
jgi:hypothetical protein